MGSISIRAKVNIIAAMTAALFIALTASIQFSTFRNKQFLGQVNLSYQLLDKSVVPLVGIAKGLSLDVSQVQQFLTDIAATRGLDGLDDGFKDAEENAGLFRKEIAEAKRLAAQLGDAELAASIDRVAVEFEPYYTYGKEMAEIYVKEGPAGGNPKMPDFDKQADRMREELAKVIELTQTASERSRQQTSEAISQLDEAIDFERTVAYVFAVLAIAFATVIAFTLRRSVSRPLGAMTTAMGELGRGNFDVELPGLGRKDEIGAMAQSVQSFKVKAAEKAHLEAEERQAQQRAAAAAKLSEEERIAAERAVAAERQEAASKQAIHEVLREFESAIGGIVGTVSGAAGELEATADTLTKAANATQRLSSVVASASDQASANVQSVASATEEMSVSIQEISRQVHESSMIAGYAVKQAETTDVRINELSKAATRIGDVVKLITAIAEQTNLLALNATIEAARAGEAGRGFAVVAQEVKALASQTAKATDEIGAQIVGMQTATQESVAAIKEIGGTIGKISEIAAAIAAAVNEQGAATQEIARNVGEAAKGTTEVATSITDVNHHASETSASSAQMLLSAQSLSGEANRLRAEMDKFLHTIRDGLGNPRKADDPNYSGPDRRTGNRQPQNLAGVKRAV